MQHAHLLISLSLSLSTMNLFLTILLFLIPIFFILVTIKRRTSPQLPPGSLGLPVIGQSLSLLWAMRANTAEKWLEERVNKYGPISKLSLFGNPAVFIYGQAANKLVFTYDGRTIANKQTTSITAILGERSLLELNGEDHKRVRDALVSFLKPECLKQYVGKMDAEVRRHLEMHWEGTQTVTVCRVNLQFLQENKYIITQDQGFALCTSVSLTRRAARV